MTRNHSTAGAVKAVGLHMTVLEEEAKRVRALLESGAQVVELDPSIVEPSPIVDRMEDDGAGFEALKSSIAEGGQQVPILVRPNPRRPDGYEAAYGHRRLRAARELGIGIRAIVQALSDEELVLAQGIENSARQDLSFIEQAIFAVRMHDLGHKQDVIARALSVPRQNATAMISVARAIPREIALAIGRAPKAGRPRWTELAELLKGGVSDDVATAIASQKFSSLSSDERFIRVLRAAATQPGSGKEQHPLSTASGSPIGSFVMGARSATLKMEDKSFAAWLAERVPALYAEFNISRTLTTASVPHSASAAASGRTHEE